MDEAIREELLICAEKLALRSVPVETGVFVPGNIFEELMWLLDAIRNDQSQYIRVRPGHIPLLPGDTHDAIIARGIAMGLLTPRKQETENPVE